jgi:hypothetical protein
VPFDRVLRERNGDPWRREAWLRDQYHHPEEHRHTLAEVQGWFTGNAVEYLRAYPSAVLNEDSEELFAPAADNWRFEGWLAQLGWMCSLPWAGVPCRRNRRMVTNERRGPTCRLPFGR